MARKAGTKSTVEVGIDELLKVLSPFKGTPLKVSLGTGWANSVAVLGVTFSSVKATAPDEGEEGDEGEEDGGGERRPSFAVEG